jgi:hypothetical protein
VPPLAGDRICASDHSPVDDKAAADAGAKDDAEDNWLPRRRSIRRFRQRKAVGIVRQTDRPFEVCRKILRQRAAVQPRRVGVLHETRGRRHHPGHPDTDRGLPDNALRLRDQRGNRVERPFVVTARRGDALTKAHVPVAIEGDDFNLRPAEVYANTQGNIASRTGSIGSNVVSVTMLLFGEGADARVNQIARIPAAMAPSMSAVHESPIITASSGDV